MATTSIRWRTLIHAAATAGCITFLGCVSPGTHDPGYVGKEWSMTMREYGIVPVFPPREDIQVGDVYAMPVSPDEEIQMRTARSTNGKFLPIPILLASIDMKDELKQFYRSRISLPPTPGGPTTQAGIMTQPTGADGGSVFSSDDDKRLRLGGFPEFFSAQISEGGIGALVPTEAVDIAFGALASANKRVRVSIPMVESYGLPATSWMQKVKVEGSRITFGDPGPNGANTSSLTMDQIKRLVYPAGEMTSKPNTQDGASGYFVLITEIFATRAIDVSVETDLSRAGNLGLKPSVDLLNKLKNISAPPTAPASSTGGDASGGGSTNAGADASTSATTGTNTGSSAGNTTSGTNNAASGTNTGTTSGAGSNDIATPPATPPAPPPSTAADYEPLAAPAAAARARNAADAMVPQVPGVNVKYTSVTAFGVSMRRTYERPIVIGYRGIVFNIDQFDNVVIAGTANANVGVAGTLLEAQPVVEYFRKNAASLQRQFGATLEVTPVDQNGVVNEFDVAVNPTDRSLFDKRREDLRKEVERAIHGFEKFKDAKVVFLR